LGRWQPPLWRASGGDRVLVIAPHPDDEIGCAGALLLHARAADAVHVLYVTDGRASRSFGLAPDEMAAQRKQEAAAARPVLQLARTHWLGLRENEWEESALVPVLRDMLRQIAPRIVYAPSQVDFHPGHIRIAQCLAVAFDDPGVPDVTVRVYQIQVPLTPVLVNLVAPIHAVVPEVVEAMRCYRTQLGSIERLLRMKRYAGSFYGLPGLVEEFWQMDRYAYGRVHAASRDEDAFRSLRHRPFTDPLAYLQGLDARRTLRGMAAVS
jgi:LmbE family N-acetylglucosaminyl deacetylase